MRVSRTVPVSLALWLLCAAVVYGSYEPYQTFEMVGGAGLIVAGKIESLNDKTFILRIDHQLAGKHTGDNVEVRRFHDWACSWRYGPYEVGQEMIAFLVSDDEPRPDDGKITYRTMGAGCESEFPIRDGMAYCYTSMRVPESKKGSIGRHDEILMLPAETVYSAIAGYRALYKVTLGTFETANKEGHPLFTRRIERLNAKMIVSQGNFRPRRAAPTMLERLRGYAGQSLLHRHLVDSTENVGGLLGTSVGWKTQHLDQTPMPTIIHYSKGP